MPSVKPTSYRYSTKPKASTPSPKGKDRHRNHVRPLRRITVRESTELCDGCPFQILAGICKRKGMHTEAFCTVPRLSDHMCLLTVDGDRHGPSIRANEWLRFPGNLVHQVYFRHGAAVRNKRHDALPVARRPVESRFRQRIQIPLVLQGWLLAITIDRKYICAASAIRERNVGGLFPASKHGEEFRCDDAGRAAVDKCFGLQPTFAHPHKRESAAVIFIAFYL